MPHKTYHKHRKQRAIKEKKKIHLKKTPAAVCSGTSRNVSLTQMELWRYSTFSFFLRFCFCFSRTRATFVSVRSKRRVAQQKTATRKTNGLIKQRLMTKNSWRELPFIYYLYGQAVWSQTATAELSSMFEWASSVRLCLVETSVFPLLAEEVKATTSRKNNSTNRKASLAHNEIYIFAVH